MPKALILGITGQDGAYLAHFLYGKGYEIVGTSRDATQLHNANLVRLGISDAITNIVSVSTHDFRSVIQLLMKFQPDEIYHLAGQSSVGASFDQPIETMESIAVSALNMLEAIRLMGRPVRYYNAGSSECFGNTPVPARESSPFMPRSPYATAKSAAFWAIANYREAYNLYACSGILFNHESPLRPTRFVTSKIISAARRIRSGSTERLQLGNIDVQRDWGWAPEYVQAMWLMLQQQVPDDYIIATGETNSLSQFVEEAFSQCGRDWRQHVDVNANLLRPSEIMVSRADTQKAARVLGWKAKKKMRDVIAAMLADEMFP
jgi:GDPmannose 4,6-dehydratase